MTRSSNDPAAPQRSRRGRVPVAVTVALLLAGAVAGVAWYRWPQRTVLSTDADTIRTPRATAALREVLWQPPIPLADVINTHAEDYEPRLSWDGLTLYFVRGRAGQNADIYTTQRTPSGWTAPAPLVLVNSPADDLGPAPAPDGTALYFYSNRDGGSGGYDLYVARPTADGWTEPANLGPIINSEFNDYGPALAPAGALVFASNRPRATDAQQVGPEAWPATVREDLYQHTYDLYVVQLGPAGPHDLRPLDALNSPANEGAPCLSPAGDFLYFSSDRPGGLGGFDLYRARLIRDAWLPPENLRAPVNTQSNELDPGLAALGYGLYFSSDRPTERVNAAHPHDYNLYYSASREVFTEIETTPRPAVNWAGLWDVLGPNLLWALLALLLLLLLLTFLRDAHRRRLSLLARCLLASLLVHLLLMLIFNVWQVTAAAVDYARRGGEIRVALAAAGPRAALANQLRGAATSLSDLPAVTKPELSRADLVPDSKADQPLHQTDFAAAKVTVPAPRFAVVTTDAVLPRPEAPPLSPSAISELTTCLPPVPAAAARSDETLPRVQPATPELRRAEASTPAPLELTVPAAPLPSPNVALPATPARFEPSHRVDARDAVLAAAPAVPLNPAAPLQLAAPPTPAPESGDRDAAPSPPPTPEASAPRAPLALSGPSATPTLPSGPLPPRALPGAEEPAHPALRASAAPPPPLDLTAHALTSQLILDVAAPAQPVLPLQSRVTEQALKMPAAENLAPAARPDLRVTAPSSATPSFNPALPNAVAALPATSPAQLVSAAAASPSSNDALPPAVLPLASVQLSLALPGAPHLPPEPELRAPGIVSGMVRDAASGVPLPDATVRLDRDGDDLVATSGADGRYSLAVSDVPDYFALSASCGGYLPDSANVSGRALRDGPVHVDFELAARTRDLVIVEELPDVHHLGNDRFDGRINSQFQKPSEGLTYVAEFELTASQARVSQLRLTLMAKGVQCPHEIRLNGAVAASLDRSPTDGSFGEFAAELEPDRLREGLNRLEIHSARCSGDIDDFEFVNVQLHLRRALPD